MSCQRGRLCRCGCHCYPLGAVSTALYCTFSTRGVVVVAVTVAKYGHAVMSHLPSRVVVVAGTSLSKRRLRRRCRSLWCFTAEVMSLRWWWWLPVVAMFFRCCLLCCFGGGHRMVSDVPGQQRCSLWLAMQDGVEVYPSHQTISKRVCNQRPSQYRCRKSGLLIKDHKKYRRVVGNCWDGYWRRPFLVQNRGLDASGLSDFIGRIKAAGRNEKV